MKLVGANYRQQSCKWLEALIFSSVANIRKNLAKIFSIANYVSALQGGHGGYIGQNAALDT
jgi:hypothetical protein